MRRPRTHVLAVLVVCAAALLLRAAVVDRQGLWVDEIFSLAMATGHSLEHPAAGADPARGDFVEHRGPMPAAVYRAYAEHERPAAGPGRVVRAVLRSDTSPPLYYLLLNLWTRLAGTGDRALRLFSVLWSIASIPLLASLARRLGGRRAVVPACVLFAFAPQSVYYSTEGRMYSLLWFLVLATAWLTVGLHRRNAPLAVLLLWVGASAAGLLTHYFFAFPWAALCLWLLVHSGPRGRLRLVLAVLVVGLAVLPWYRLLPQSMTAWRVTRGWLEQAPDHFRPLAAQLELAWSYVTANGEWWYPSPVVSWALLALLGLVLAAALWRLGRRAVGPRWQLLWLWLVATNVGLLAFDLWQGTYTRAFPRYALAGLPAACLLIAAALARLPAAARALATAAVVALWAPALRRIYTNESRAGSPIREVARLVGGRSGAADLVIVHSIPAGVVGVARYLTSEAAVAAWVGQLGTRRVPDDAARLVRGRERVFLVKVHDLGAPAPEEAWLRERATVVGDTRRQVSQTVEFVRRDTAGGRAAAVVVNGDQRGS